MKLIKRILTISFITLFCFSNIAPVFATDNGVTPYAQVVPCTSSYNVLTKTGNNLNEIFKRLPKFALVGQALQVTQSYADTISNNTTITLIPEFLELGYERSIEVGFNIGWTMTNTTNVTLQLVILAIYDTFSVKQYDMYTLGSCYLTTKTYKIYEGDTFDLRP